MVSGSSFTVADPAPHRPHRAPLCRKDGTPLQILIVDDERVVTEIVSTTLRYEGGEVITASDGDTAVAAARRVPPDVVILDSSLPDMSGPQILDLLREHRPGLPVLLLNTHTTVPGGVAALSAGGDDWLMKPFSLEELVLKLRTLLRRRTVGLLHDAAEIVVGDLVLNDDSREVRRGGDFIHLSRREFELLRYFMHNAERVVTKHQILGRVWPYDFTGDLSVVGLYISYLRKKIDADRLPMIHTLRRTGYILKAPH